MAHLTPPSFQKEGMSKGQSSTITKAWQVTKPERASEYVRKPKKENKWKTITLTKGKTVDTLKEIDSQHLARTADKEQKCTVYVDTHKRD